MLAQRRIVSSPRRNKGLHLWLKLVESYPLAWGGTLFPQLTVRSPWVGLVDITAIIGTREKEHCLWQGQDSPDHQALRGSHPTVSEWSWVVMHVVVGISKAQVWMALNGSRTLALKTWGRGVGREEGRQEGWEGRNRPNHLWFESWEVCTIHLSTCT